MLRDIKSAKGLGAALLAVGAMMLVPVDEATAACRGAWAEGVNYVAGDTVTYSGTVYTARVNHGCNGCGWNPVAAPSLWAAGGTCTGTGTPTPTPATPTPRPGSTPTPTPTPGSGCFPAWVSGNTYVGGNQVSRNGINYRAAYWTQADPASNNGPAGSGQPWNPQGGCTGGGTPSPTPAPTSTPTPGPTPTPTPVQPTPTPCSNCGGGAATNLVTGYWHNFNNGSTTMKLNAINSRYNLIAVSFADATGTPGQVTFNLDPATGYTDANEFRSHVSSLNAAGRKVIISVGGQNGTVSVSDSGSATNFANSIVGLMDSWGFAGVDIDLENGLNATFMGQALRNIASRKPGAIITMAPQTIDMQPGQVNGSGYFRLALDIRNILTVVNMQYYNSGTMLGCDGQVYSQGTLNFLTALACIQLQAGLAPSQVGLGVPASSSAAGGGFYTPAVVNTAMRCLESRTSCGSFVPPQAWPGIRGAMTWSVNWDAVQGYSWVNTISVP